MNQIRIAKTKKAGNLDVIELEVNEDPTAIPDRSVLDH